jgi:hypothetical protein
MTGPANWPRVQELFAVAFAPRPRVTIAGDWLRAELIKWHGSVSPITLV